MEKNSFVFGAAEVEAVSKSAVPCEWCSLLVGGAQRIPSEIQVKTSEKVLLSGAGFQLSKSHGRTQAPAGRDQITEQYPNYSTDPGPSKLGQRGLIISPKFRVSGFQFREKFIPATRSCQKQPDAASASFECRVSSFEIQSGRGLLHEQPQNADKTG